MASTCCCPGCEKVGTSRCSACKTANYCGPNCQTEDWPRHKEECEGHLETVGMKNLTKAQGFQDSRNYVNALRHADLAITKLKAMKNRSLQAILAISEGLKVKCAALEETHRPTELLECAKENYNLWTIARGPADTFTIDASLFLIDSSLANKLYEDAELFARTLWEIIHNDRESRNIPAMVRPMLVARTAGLLAQAIYRLAESGSIPKPEEKEKAGKAAIARARQSVEMYTQLYGTEDALTAIAMLQLAQILDYFNNVDDDEILRLCEHTIHIFLRLDRRKSQNVAVGENTLGVAYKRRAHRA